MDTPTKAVKLNIFALPSQTTILFWLMVTVLLGTVLAGSIGPSPVCIWPLALGLLFLPLRRFLAWPDREIAQHHFRPADDSLAALHKAIAEDAQRIGLARVPHLVIGTDETIFKAFGSFRRWYIAIGREYALHLQSKLTDSNEALAVHARIIHELYHFKNGDYWQVGYARELFRTVAVFLTWVMAFGIGYGFLLLYAAPYVVHLDLNDLVNRVQTLTPEMREMFLQVLPAPEAMADLRQRASAINLSLVITFITNATLPLILAGSLLWLFYWRKLLRVREFYADAGVVHAQSEVTPLLSALTGIPLRTLRLYPDQGESVPTYPRQTGESWKSLVKKLWENLGNLLKYHPPLATRITCLKEPAQAFDTWIGVSIVSGSLILILDIVLVSPLTLLYIGDWPMHFSILAVFTIMSLWAITPIILGQSTWRNALKIIAVVVGLRLVWLSLTLGLLIVLSPAALAEMLTIAVANTARYAGHLEGPAFPDPGTFVIKASLINIAQVFIIMFVLVIAVRINILLIGRLLTWYGFHQAHRWLMWVAYLMISLGFIFWGLTVLPLLTTALLRPTDLLNPVGILRSAIGFIITAIGFGLFLYADKHYGRRCPACNNFVPGPYRLGRHCACGELLHPWLIAEYDA